MAKVKAENENRDQIFGRVLQCTRSLVDFHLMAQYKSHTSRTLARMQAYFAEFHDTKTMFLEFRGLKSVSMASKIAVQHVRNYSDGQTSCVAEDEEGPIGFAARISLNKRRKDSIDVRRQERDARQKAVEETSHFHFMKIHLPHHYRAHVEQLGAISAFSTESGESAHKRQVKEGYNYSNRHDVNKQIIEYYTRVSALLMREQNLKQLVKEGVSPVGKVLVDGQLLMFTDSNQNFDKEVRSTAG